MTAGADSFSPNIPPRPFIHELPPELLCDIFAAIDDDDYRDLVACTHVCRFWRTLSLASPGRLWANVRSVHGRPGVFEQTMARTQHAPAQVNVVVRASNAEEVARVLKEHLGHIRSLSIQSEEDLETSLAEELALALSVRAPLLQMLVIMDIFHVFETGYHGCLDQVFGGQPLSHLSTIKMYCSSRPYVGIPAFSNVRSAMYAPIGMVFLPNQLQDVLHFGTFDRLELLALEIRTWHSITGYTQKLPPSLKGLSLVLEDGWTNAVEFLSCLDDHRDVQLVRVTYNDVVCEPDIAADVLEYVLPSAGRVFELTIDSSTSNLAIFEATTAAGFQREVSDVPAMLSEAAFQHLTRLSISEWEWIGIDPMPPAPVLTHLTVRLVAPAYMDLESMHRSVFVDLDAGGVLSAPRLHTFGVSTRRRGDPTLLGTSPALAPETVSQFLADRLVYDRKPLPVLFLNGVRLLENLVDQVITLLDLVEDVQCGPGHVHAHTELDDVVSWD